VSVVDTNERMVVQKTKIEPIIPTNAESSNWMVALNKTNIKDISAKPPGRDKIIVLIEVAQHSNNSLQIHTLQKNYKVGVRNKGGSMHTTFATPEYRGLVRPTMLKTYQNEHKRGIYSCLLEKNRQNPFWMIARFNGLFQYFTFRIFETESRKKYF